MTPAEIAAVASPEVAAFWSRVDVRGAADCWPWHGAKIKAGRGVFCFQGSRTVASRYALEVVRGPVLTAEKPLALHHCDNPPCCNPMHLYAGDYNDNMRDCVSRRRLAIQRRTVCRRGHDLTAPSAFFEWNGRRECRGCRRVHKSEYQARRRARQHLETSNG